MRTGCAAITPHSPLLCVTVSSNGLTIFYTSLTIVLYQHMLYSPNLSYPAWICTRWLGRIQLALLNNAASQLKRSHPF
jgi:hypothetical protein